jgi:hypothetical protein
VEIGLDGRHGRSNILLMAGSLAAHGHVGIAISLRVCTEIKLTRLYRYAIVGLATLIAHKSVEQLRFWGVPSMYIEGMKVLHAFIWLMGALAMTWLCTVATIKFCRKVSRELL